MVRFKPRLTGFNAFGVGVEWDLVPSDAELARGVLAFLEDRRILWEDMRYEVEHECLLSAEKAREYLTGVIQTPGIGATLSNILAEIRQLFTAFTMRSRRHEFLGRGPYGPDELSLSLGELRAAVGDRIAALCFEYNLELGPNLHSIVPDSGRWFFDEIG
jgi:hypothetical protein